MRIGEGGVGTWHESDERRDLSPDVAFSKTPFDTTSGDSLPMRAIQASRSSADRDDR